MASLGQIHFLVKGKVQGVGFRAFVRGAANRCGIVGWVRNLSDGRVEGIAIGEQDQLKEFEKRVSKGAPPSQVDDFQSRSRPLDYESLEFKIEKDGESPWYKD